MFSIQNPGTSITVFGGLQPIQQNGQIPPHLKIHFAIDDGEREEYVAQITEPKYYRNTTYYQSPSLPMGEHVLLIMNVVEMSLLWLDRFLIYAESPGKPELLRSDGSFKPSPVVTPLSTPTGTGSSGSTISIPTQNSPTGTTSQVESISKTPSTLQSTVSSMLSGSSSPSGTSTLHSSFSMDNTIANGAPITSPAPATTYLTILIDTHGSSPKPLQTKHIIALASCGGFAVILFLTLLLVFIRRHKRSRKQIQVIQPMHDPYTGLPQRSRSILLRKGGINSERSIGTSSGSPARLSTAPEDFVLDISQPDPQGWGRTTSLENILMPVSTTLPPYVA